MAPELRSDLRVSRVKVRDLGALSQAQVVVENVSSVRYTLEYQFNWSDDEGFAVGTTRTWHRFTLAPGERESFTSTGQVPSATNTEFSLRLPDDYFLNDDEQQQPPWRDQEAQPRVPQIENRGDFPDDLPGR